METEYFSLFYYDLKRLSVSDQGDIFTKKATLFRIAFCFMTISLHEFFI